MSFFTLVVFHCSDNNRETIFNFLCMHANGQYHIRCLKARKTAKNARVLLFLKSGYLTKLSKSFILDVLLNFASWPNLLLVYIH